MTETEIFEIEAFLMQLVYNVREIGEAEITQEKPLLQLTVYLEELKKQNKFQGKND